MVDFIVNLFSEIADFFITFWIDNVIDKLSKKEVKFLYFLSASKSHSQDRLCYNQAGKYGFVGAIV